MAAGIVSQQSLLPVTALEFCTVSGSLYLLAGEGPHLKVFAKNGHLMTQVELLPFSKIHGIRPSQSSSASDASGSRNVLAFGQKSLRFVTLQEGGILVMSNPATSLEDWILDVCWLDRDRDAVCDTYTIAAVTAHNAVHVIKCSSCGGEGEVVAKYFCEVNCILPHSYSARLKGESESGLTVVSGTVFNDILLWCVDEGDSHSPTENSVAVAEKRAKVRLSLSGHEGVIFSIWVNEDASHLVSVSDDRTVRVWDLPLDWKSMERCRQSSCSLLLYGHTARVWDARLLPDCVISIGEDATCRVWDYRGQCVQVVEWHRGRSIWSMAVDGSLRLVATGGADCSIRLFSLQTHNKDSNVWSLDTTLPASMSPDSESLTEETPRSVELCGQTALCLSNTGSLYAGEIPALTTADAAPGTVVWQLVHKDREFSGYAVMSLSPDHQWLALGSLQGCIALLFLEMKNGLSVACDVKWCGHKAKVFSLTWLNHTPEYSNTLLSCGPSGEMVVWKLCRSGPNVAADPLVCMSLPPSKHRWVTSALLLRLPTTSLDSVSSTDALTTTDSAAVIPVEDSSLSPYWLVCGDRKGSLHVYQTNLSTKENECIQPMQSLRGVHGSNGVTHITANEGHLVTCGRDGHCRTFSIHPHRGLAELTKFKPVKGMDWIERQLYSDTDHLILGFHATEMLLFSVPQNKCVMSISCGGGHRSYGCTSLPELSVSKRAVVVYIKKSVISFRVVDLTAQLTSPPLQMNFVGREAVSLQILHNDPVTGSAVAAVGSEDCSVCLLSLQPSSDGHTLTVRTERFVQGHISSVRALSTSQSMRGPLHSTLLFSGGARASLKIWKINVSGVSSRAGRPEVTLEAEVSIHNDAGCHKGMKMRRKKPKGPGAKSLLPECRIMALTSLPLSQVVDDEDAGRHYVAAGCSDGIVRQYIYNEETHSFSPQENLQFHNRCILTLNHIVFTSELSTCQRVRTLCVLSAATDGNVVVWNVSKALLVPNASGVEDCRGEVNGSTRPLAVCQAHQSGINDIAIQQVKEGVYYLSTVGDDNALAVLILTLPAANSLQTTCLKVLCIERNAHASSITGVSFLSPSVVVTTSVDQRLSVWRMRVSGSTDTAGALTTLGSSQQAVRVDHVYSHTHDVADVSSLSLYHWGQDRAVVVICGIGVQSFIIQK